MQRKELKRRHKKQGINIGKKKIFYYYVLLYKERQREIKSYIKLYKVIKRHTK